MQSTLSRRLLRGSMRSAAKRSLPCKEQRTVRTTFEARRQQRRKLHAYGPPSHPHPETHPFLCGLVWLLVGFPTNSVRLANTKHWPPKSARWHQSQARRVPKRPLTTHLSNPSPRPAQNLDWLALRRSVSHRSETLGSSLPRYHLPAPLLLRTYSTQVNLRAVRVAVRCSPSLKVSVTRTHLGSTTTARLARQYQKQAQVPHLEPSGRRQSWRRRLLMSLPLRLLSGSPPRSVRPRNCPSPEGGQSARMVARGQCTTLRPNSSL